MRKTYTVYVETRPDLTSEESTRDKAYYLALSYGLIFGYPSWILTSEEFVAPDGKTTYNIINRECVWNDC